MDAMGSTRELLTQILGKQAERVPSEASLETMRSMKATELIVNYNLSPSGAARLVAAIEIGRRAHEQPLLRGAIMRQSADVFRHFHTRMRDLKVEQFMVVLLDGKHRMITEHMVSQGTLTSSPVHPREVFSLAIRLGAAAVVLVHNHPSGDPSPSADDLEITRRLCETGSLVGIRVVDHIVVGDGSYASFAERGLLPFPG